LGPDLIQPPRLIPPDPNPAIIFSDMKTHATSRPLPTPHNRPFAEAIPGKNGFSKEAPQGKKRWECKAKVGSRGGSIFAAEYGG
jgi:hypothetical protein